MFHITAAITDRGTTFNEGFAEHLKAIMAHFSSDRPLRNYYQHRRMTDDAGSAVQFGFLFPISDLSNYAQNFARLLIEQAIQVWSVIGSKDNAVWPGWNASGTPLLFYLPGEQDVLIGHDHPPQGFREYQGPLAFPGSCIMIRDGETLIEFDGQNTAMDVNGTQTLVVADTLSNRLPRIQSLVANAAAGGDVKVEYNVLRSNPMSSMEMIAHEAFHVYQHHQAPDKSGNELDLAYYPTLHVENSLGFALEGNALSRALEAADPQVMRRAAVEWLAIRSWRREQLSERCVAYEDGTEFNEGLAKYIEYRLTQALEGTEPRPSLWMIQGFPGFQDLQAERERLLKMMRSHMSGEVVVNNDLYGASPLRMRFYFSGMAIAALLDRISPDWKEQIFTPGTSLTSLAATALATPPEQLEPIAQEVIKRRAVNDLRIAKQKLAGDGEAYIQQVLATIQDGPSTTIVLDYSAVTDASVKMAFTPFGILAVDDDRTVFRLVPLTVRIRPETSIRQLQARDLLHDRNHKTISWQLSDRISAADLTKQLQIADSSPDSPTLVVDKMQVDSLAVPGAELEIGWAEFSLVDNKLTIRLLPE